MGYNCLSNKPMYDSYPNITLTFLYNISDLLVYIIDFQCCKNSSITLSLKSLQILGISAINCISHTYENPYTSNKYLTWLAKFLHQYLPYKPTLYKTYLQ